MSQSEQAVEQAEQGVGQIINESVVPRGQLLGTSGLLFEFFPSRMATRMARFSLSNIPPGTQGSFIVLQGFNVRYVDEDYELENLQVSLGTEVTTEGVDAIITATLRDRNLDKNGNGREWQGSVTGLVQHFGTPPNA